MLNFSGITYRIWAVSAIFLILGVICLILARPWKEGLKSKTAVVGLVIIAYAVISGAIYISRIASSDVSVYMGKYIECYRNSRVAPPLPFTDEFTFEAEEGHKLGVYLDIFAQKSILPSDFEEGKTYIVHYDELTNIILGIEVAE